MELRKALAVLRDGTGGGWRLAILVVAAFAGANLLIAAIGVALALGPGR